jgi:integrase
MQEKIIKHINLMLEKSKMTKKAIYENLLSIGLIRPNSENFVNEILKYGVDNNLISERNIIKYKKRKGKLPSIFTREQLIKIFERIDNPKLAMACFLGFFCGLRIMEVCRLRIEDIDLTSKTLKIVDSKNTNRALSGYGKDRYVPIPDIIISPIKKWLEIIQGGKWFLASYQSSDKHIRPKTLQEQLRNVLTECGLDQIEQTKEFKAINHGKKKDMKHTTYKYRFHIFRHSYATYLLDKGIPLQEIQRLLGHEKIDTTLIYSKISDKKMYENVNSAFNNFRPINNNHITRNEINNQNNNTLSALDILNMRFAKGEIDLLTYKRMKKELNLK